MIKRKHLWAVGLSSILGIFFVVWAADGGLDTTFNSTGKQQINFANSTGDTFQSGAIQTTVGTQGGQAGDLLAAGVFEINDDAIDPANRLFIQRFTANGGLVGTTRSVALDVTQENEKVVVSPTGRIIVVSNFCQENAQTEAFEGCACAFTEYNDSGTRVQGPTRIPANGPNLSQVTFCEADVVFEADGKITAGGGVLDGGVFKPALFRLNANLTADTSFSGDGIAPGLANVATTVNFNFDSNANSGGFTDPQRIISDGASGYYLLSRDQSKNDETETDDPGTPQNETQVLVDYVATQYLLHFNANGSVDMSFGSNGIAEINRTTVDADGTVTRDNFNGGGQRPANTYRKNHEREAGLLRMPDGTIVVSGSSFCFSDVDRASCTDQSQYLVRRLANGQPDSTFNGGVSGNTSGKLVSTNFQGFGNSSGFRLPDVFLDDQNRLHVLSIDGMGRVLSNGANDPNYTFSNANNNRINNLNQRPNCSANNACSISGWNKAVPMLSGSIKTVYLLGGIRDFDAEQGRSNTADTAIVARVKLNDPPDAVPDDPFLFIAQTGVARGSTSISDSDPNTVGNQPLTIRGLNVSNVNAMITSNGHDTGRASLNGNGFTIQRNQVFQVSNGDTIQLQQTNFNFGETTTRTTLTVGPAGFSSFSDGVQVPSGTGGSRTINFDTTTAPADFTPDENFVDFTPQTGVAFSTFITSNTQTITGIEDGAPLSANGGQFSIGCNPNGFVSSGTINNGQSVCVRGASSGDRATKTTVNLTIGPNTTRKFEITTRNAGRADLTPNPLAFGSVPSGVTRDMTATLLNISGSPADAPLTNLSFMTTGTDFSVLSENCPDSLPSGNSCQITVRFTPTGAAAKTGTLTVGSDAVNPSVQIALSGTSTAPAPVISLDPASRDFGSLRAGQSSTPLMFTLTNTGNADLTIGTKSATGQFTQTNDCPATVAPNANCTFMVTYSPTGARGARTGQLVVTGSGSQVGAVPNGTANLSGSVIAPALTLTPSLSFGERRTNGGASGPMTMTVTNSGDAPMTITEIAKLANGNPADFTLASNNCPVSPATLSSTAGSNTCTVGITFLPSADGARTATVNVVTDGGTAQSGLSGTGISPRASLSPTSLTFNSQAIGSTSATQTVTLSSTGTDTLTITSISKVAGGDSGQFNLVSSCPASLNRQGSASGTSCTFTVSFSPTGSAGSRTATVNVVTDDPTMGTRTVTLNGSAVESSIAFTPSSLSFGEQRVGRASAAQQISVQNVTSSPLSNVAVTVSGEYALVAPSSNPCTSTLAANSSCNVAVTFTPTAVGARPAGQVAVASNAVEGSANHRVPLSGTGIAPMLTVAPASVAFGNQRVGVQSSGQTLTLTNNGSDTLAISSITVGGTNAAEFVRLSGTNGGSCASELLEGASCTVITAFTPTARGARAAVLTIASDALGSATTAVNLGGTGIAPVIAISPASLAFGDQRVNTLSTPARTITVSNTGDAPLVVGAPSVTGNTADFPFTNGCGSAVTGGSSCTISVQFMPSATGSRSGSLSIPSDALNAATVTAALTGNGTAPMIALSPTSLDFGTQPDDASIPPRSITLTNSGTATLTVTGITLTGGQAADYRQTNTCTTVAAGGTCSISVTFAPTDVGTRSAMLSIASDASAQASVVSLTGNAVSREQTTSNPSTGAQPVSLTASQGEIVSFTPVVTNPSGAGSDFTYPLGFFNFRAEGLPTSGTPATVTFTYTFPAGTQVDSYVKCRTPTDCSRFAGAVVSGNTLTLTITDNGAGDNDPAQGVIVDPGAPALSANRRLDVQSGGGSMSLLAVVLLGLGVLWQRARRQGVFMLGLMAFAGSASAQIAPHEAGIGSLYMGGSLAYAKASPDSASVTRNLRAQGFNVTADVEDTAPGGSLSVGWFYSHRAAVELQAIHAGKFESEVTGTTPAQAAAISAALVDELAGTGNGLGLNLRWDYPLGQHWDLVHRFGAYAWRTQVEVSDGSQTRESTKNGIGGHTSLGVHRWFNKNLSAGAGANLFRPNSDNTFWHVYVQMEYAIGSL